MEVPDRIISLRLEVEGKLMLYVALQAGCHIEEKDEIWSKVVNIVSWREKVVTAVVDFRGHVVKPRIQWWSWRRKNVAQSLARGWDRRRRYTEVFKGRRYQRKRGIVWKKKYSKVPGGQVYSKERGKWKVSCMWGWTLKKDIWTCIDWLNREIELKGMSGGLEWLRREMEMYWRLKRACRAAQTMEEVLWGAHELRKWERGEQMDES